MLLDHRDACLRRPQYVEGGFEKGQYNIEQRGRFEVEPEVESWEFQLVSSCGLQVSVECVANVPVDAQFELIAS